MAEPPLADAAPGDPTTEPAFVTLTRREDGVAVVRLDRPKVNALSAAVLRQLRTVADELRADPPGAVVVWGGEKVFAAGADVAELGQVGAPAVSQEFHQALTSLASVPRAVIAAVNGYALGGGLELALACDLRVCGEDAVFGLPEVLLGIIPGAGGTQRLPRLVGAARAKDMVLTGRQVRPEEAVAMGLVNRVVAPDRALPAALELAATLARGARLAQALAKDAIDRGLDVTLEEGLAIESERFAAAHRTEDAALGIESFLARGPGKATFRGR